MKKKTIITVLILFITIFLIIFGIFNISKNNNLNNELEDTIVNKENETIEEKNSETENVEKNNFVNYNGWLRIENNILVNENSEPFRLKGISTHGLQWYSKFANKEMMKSLKENLDINLFRIALYTEENGYINNPSLIDKVEEIVEYAKELDMYVIIDWHILSDGDPLKHKEEAKIFFEKNESKI